MLTYDTTCLRVKSTSNVKKTKIR